MANSSIIILTGTAFLVGILISWIVTKSHWAGKLLITKADFERAEKQLEEQKTFIANSEKAMKESFGFLAARALNSNNAAFVSLAESKLSEKVTEARGLLEGKEQAIQSLVKPLADSLNKMDKKINELETKREGAYINIATVLEGMQRTAVALDKGTQGLINALKNSNTRGRYGEIGLRRVVEFSGMTEHCDFVEQVSVAGEDGLLRPDMNVKLPDNKTIVVDSKTPLDAYMKVFETDNDAEQKLLLAQHARAVKDHLRKLGAKSYWSQFPESPDYVILYMQIESSFGAAVQTDPTLIEEGIRNKVIFATPTTLIMLLKTASFVWEQRSIAANIEEIRNAGIELYDRSTVLFKHFQGVGAGLRNAVTHFNNAASSLESRFFPQARKIHALGHAFTRSVLPEIDQIDAAVREIDLPDELASRDDQ